ncbi:MAG: hypothetical protein WCL02_02050 [bacterium]
MKRELIFPPQEANLPLVLLTRPHGYLVVVRIIGLFIIYLRLLIIYTYNTYRQRESKKEK